MGRLVVFLGTVFLVLLLAQWLTHILLAISGDGLVPYTFPVACPAMIGVYAALRLRYGDKVSRI